MSRYHHVSTSSSYDGGHTAYARFIEDVDDAVLGLGEAGDLQLLVALPLVNLVPHLLDHLLRLLRQRHELRRHVLQQ